MNYKVAYAHNQNDAAAWNIIGLGMCLYPQPPDSNVRLDSSSCRSTPSANSPSTLLGAATTPSSRTYADGGVELSSSNCTTETFGTSASNRLYSGLGNSLKSLDQDKRSRSSFSIETDEEKSTLSRFEDQYHGGMRVLQSYGAPKDSPRLSVGYEPLVIPMGRPELSSSSSSIGDCDDSSCSSGDGSIEVTSSRDVEIESSRRGSFPQLNELEASLPIKRGLSRFWNGKSKSFSALASVSSIEELAKPDNPYARRRRLTMMGERHKSFPPLSRTSTAGISKRPTSMSGSRSGLAVAVAMGSNLVEASNEQQ